MPSERPILFSAPMVRALLAGTKTQTRRVLRFQPDRHYWEGLPGYTLRRSEMVKIDGRRAVKFTHTIPQNPAHDDATRWVCCPYGQPGDRLWVREAWRIAGHSDGDTLDMFDRDDVQYRADDDQSYIDKYRPSIHMPRRFSRITLEVTGVRVERLQDISESDAVAEGIERAHVDSLGRQRWKVCPHTDGVPGEEVVVYVGKPYTSRPIDAYRSLWLSINGPGSWGANPWVWCVSFKRTEGEATG